MFEALTEKLNSVFSRLGGKGRLTEKDIDEALKEVRLALGTSSPGCGKAPWGIRC